MSISFGMGEDAQAQVAFGFGYIVLPFADYSDELNRLWELKYNPKCPKCEGRTQKIATHRDRYFKCYSCSYEFKIGSRLGQRLGTRPFEMLP